VRKGLSHVERSCQSKGTLEGEGVEVDGLISDAASPVREATRTGWERRWSWAAMRLPTVPVPPRTRMGCLVVVDMFFLGGWLRGYGDVSSRLEYR